MIITFYSYKGGVGRTQMVANLAAYFCFYEHKRVLVIDWDLEAPGLDTYFFNEDTLKIRVKKLLTEDKIVEALEVLKVFGRKDNDYQNNIILLMSRYINNKQQFQIGSVSLKNFEIEKNKLVVKILAIFEQKKALASRENISTGLIDFLSTYIDSFQNADLSQEIEKQLPHYQDFVLNAIGGKEGANKVDIMPAGNLNSDYNYKVNHFPWEDFVTKHAGIGFIENVWKPQMLADYDYIFIDSRTGISDYSGICNIRMPQMNVILMAPNMQNIEGATKVAQEILASEYVTSGKRPSLILPLLSRVDDSFNDDNSYYFKQKFAKNALNLLNPFSEKWQEKAMDLFMAQKHTWMIEYKKDLSFGENLLFSDGEKKILEGTLNYTYQSIAKQIIFVEGNEHFFSLPIIEQISTDIFYELTKQQNEIWSFLQEINYQYIKKDLFDRFLILVAKNNSLIEYLNYRKKGGELGINSSILNETCAFMVAKFIDEGKVAILLALLKEIANIIIIVKSYKSKLQLLEEIETLSLTAAALLQEKLQKS